MAYDVSYMDSVLARSEYEVSLIEGSVTEEQRAEVQKLLEADSTEQNISGLACSIILALADRVRADDISVQEAVAAIEKEFEALGIAYFDMDVERENLETVLSLHTKENQKLYYSQKHELLAALGESDNASKFRMAYSLWLLQLHVLKNLVLDIGKVKALNSYLRSCDINDTFLSLAVRILNSAIVPGGAAT